MTSNNLRNPHRTYLAHQVKLETKTSYGFKKFLNKELKSGSELYKQRIQLLSCLEEIKDDLEDMPEWNDPNNPMQQIPQGLPTASPSGKPLPEMKGIGARELDNEIITQAINAKKLDVLGKIETMIKNATQTPKTDKKRS